MLGRKRILVGGQHANTSALRQDALHQRNLQQAGGRHRHRTMRDKLRMQDGEEAAARGDAIDAECHQFIGRAQEQVQHAIGIGLHNAIGCRAAHDGELHWKAPGRRKADVPWQALEPGVEHHDADADAMYRLPAMDFIWRGFVGHGGAPIVNARSVATKQSR